MPDDSGHDAPQRLASGSGGAAPSSKASSKCTAELSWTFSNRVPIRNTATANPRTVAVPGV